MIGAGVFKPGEYWQEGQVQEDWGSYTFCADHGHQIARDGIEAARARRIVAPVDTWASDTYLRKLAQDRAGYMLDWIVALPGAVTLDAINAQLQRLEANQIAHDCSQDIDAQMQSTVKRVTCEFFWRRQLRRAQVRKREAQAQARGVICARNMPYCHDFTAERWSQRQAENRAMLEATEIESADGDCITLWQAAQSTVSNKTIRRGELMTRIKGCEEWASAAGMVGIFTTNTTPSRFHASLFGGGINPNFDGSTPRDGQEWLSKTWARARAKIQRKKIKVFGFRVAEPHHDGCPHWHMLLWVNAGQVRQLTELLRQCWLQHEGDEEGAQAHRFKSEVMDPARGGAISYVAKYISKNIDDTGAVQFEGHFDQQGEQRELIPGTNKARRITAWASAWGIRQFQAIGQPPVTVWRELRRVDAAMVAGASKRMQRAHAAVNKTEDKQADWCAYMREQGGAMIGRAYQLRLDFETEQREGRYGPVDAVTRARVYDVARPGEFCTSNRKQWKPKGTWTPAQRHTARVGVFAEVGALVFGGFDSPWTCVNNCTDPASGQGQKSGQEWPEQGRGPGISPIFAT